MFCLLFVTVVSAYITTQDFCIPESAGSVSVCVEIDHMIETTVVIRLTTIEDGSALGILNNFICYPIILLTRPVLSVIVHINHLLNSISLGRLHSC